MEEREVTVWLRSSQAFEGFGEETVEQTVQGALKRSSRGYTLTYWEGEDTGLGRTRTTLEVEEGRVTLIRMGELSSQMVFETGQIHRSDYRTPYGVLPLEVHTHSLRADVDGGEIAIDYHITIGPQQSGRTRLRLTIRECGEREEGEER